MDNRLKGIIENYDSMKIGRNDSFRFRCKMCGKCCINRDDILLNPYDLYRIAKELGKKPHEVFTEYCETYLGSSSGMVIVRLRPRGNDKRCPLLNGNKCSVHKGKPSVCALYPLGRGIKAGVEETDEITQKGVQYILQPTKCGDTSEKHTVSEWLEEFDFLADEEYFKQWMQLAVDCGKTLKRLEELHFERLENTVANSILGGIYLNYSTSEPFLPQFERNRKAYSEIASMLASLTSDLHNE